MASRIYEWLDNRLNLKAVERTLLDEPIPGGASWIYVFGSATLFLFVLQAVTGMFLAVYYAPTPDHDCFLTALGIEAGKVLDLHGLHRRGLFRRR